MLLPDGKVNLDVCAACRYVWDFAVDTITGVSRKMFLFDLRLWGSNKHEMGDHQGRRSARAVQPRLEERGRNLLRVDAMACLGNRDRCRASPLRSLLREDTKYSSSFIS